MSDLVRVLRGQRIDGRGADEIMRRAADEIDRLRVIEQTEAAMRRRLEEAVADCERLREKLADRIEERDDSNRNLTAALQRESKLQAWLAEAERNEETLLGMIRHQRDVLRECLPYINESMAGRRPGRCADDIRAAVKALTADSGSGGEK
jgi:septal ring factor EnvC (AmiA/AmiB activator)